MKRRDISLIFQSIKYWHIFSLFSFGGSGGLVTPRSTLEAPTHLLNSLIHDRSIYIVVRLGLRDHIAVGSNIANPSLSIKLNKKKKMPILILPYNCTDFLNKES